MDRNNLKMYFVAAIATLFGVVLWAMPAHTQTQGAVVSQGPGRGYGPWAVSGLDGGSVPVSVTATTPTAGSVCNQSGMSGTTQCLGLSGSGQSYYVSSFICSANAAITCGLSSSTTAGNNCATSPTVVIAPQYIPANGGYAPPLISPIKVTANSALCCVPSAGTAACTIVYTTAP